MSDIHIWNPAIDFFGILSKANMPLSMILLGVMLSFSIDKEYLPVTIKYLCLHYGLGTVSYTHLTLPTKRIV